MAVKVVVVQVSQAPRPDVHLREWKFGSLEGVQTVRLCGDRVRAPGRLRLALSCMVEGEDANANAAMEAYS